MNAEHRVWVTRPVGQARALMASLSAEGWTPVHLPLLAIDPLDPLPLAQRQRVRDLDRYAHLIFVSANAARVGLARIQDHWPRFPAPPRYWAVGRSTAQVLEAAGLDVERPERDMSSEGLLALPGLRQVRGQRALIVRGEGGRRLIAETLRARGARVDCLCCYRRVPVSHRADDVVARVASAPADLIMISSGEGLQLLSDLLRPREHTTLAAITLLVPSPRVAERARGLGWQQVELTDNASDAAMLAAAQRWQAAHSGGEAKH